MAFDDDQTLRSIQRVYTDFLDDDSRESVYSDKIDAMIKNESCRLIVNINDLRDWNAERADSFLKSSSIELVAFHRALRDLVMVKDANYAKMFEEFFIGLEGNFGQNHVTPRTLNSKYLGQIICVEGIVTRCSLIRPKIVRSVHYCPATGKTIERKYYDMTSLESQPSIGVYPTKDDEGNLLETEFGLSTYKDHQSITVQELPEKAPPGQLPRSLDISCDNDLIDLCKPGDRVQVVGLYKSLPSKKEGVTTATFRTILLANNVLELNKEFTEKMISSDIAMIKRFSHQRPKDVFETLARSLAPTIYGMDYVKKAVLCMLVGGVEKILNNGTRLRGDINILLIGDPSVAKSQILRYVWKTAPRAISTTGRGSSGVGLTASVVANEDSGGGFDSRRLEAGACVLADRGIVCVDEFDKMTDADRTAFHEVMEQGRVTVAKAGIRASLNARCSVLAAANPVYSRYDQYKTPMENIGMQDSLLSRFDLVFILLDQADAEQDQILSEHIVRVHQFRRPGERDGQVLPLNLASSNDNGQFYSTFPMNANASFDITPSENGDVSFSSSSHMNGGLDDTIVMDGSASNSHYNSSAGRMNHGAVNKTIYEKYDRLLHRDDYKKHRILKASFLKKYIQLARGLSPQLTQEATNYISDEYVKLRAQSAVMVDNIAKTQPITVRTLETLIRLSTAHAKCRLSKTVDLIDAKGAMDMINYAYFKKVETKPKKVRRVVDRNGVIVEEDEDDYLSFSDTEHLSDSEQIQNPQQPPGSKRQKTAGDSQIFSSMEVDEPATQTSTLEPERLRQFKRQLLKIFDAQSTEFVALNYVREHINKDKSPEVLNINLDEVETALKIMTDANQIMIENGNIFRI